MLYGRQALVPHDVMLQTFNSPGLTGESQQYLRGLLWNVDECRSRVRVLSNAAFEQGRVRFDLNTRKWSY